MAIVIGTHNQDVGQDAKSAAIWELLAAEVDASRLATWREMGIDIRVQLDSQNGADSQNGNFNVVISAAGEVRLNWLRRHFQEVIRRAVNRAVGNDVQILFRVAPIMPQSTTHHSINDQKVVHKIAHPKSQSIAVTHTSHISPPQPKGRLLATFDSFVVGLSNQLAYTVLQHVVREPGSMTPLYLHGASSVGKTHLLEATFRAAHASISGTFHSQTNTAQKTAAKKGKLPLLLTAEQFTTSFISSLRQSGVPSFRAKFRNVSMVMIDDIPFFAGKRETQSELLHTLDLLLAQRVQVVFSGNLSPDALASLLRPELVARLEAGMVCEVKAAEPETLFRIGKDLAVQRAMNVSDEIIHYLVENLGSDARQISGGLHRLQAATLCDNRPITRKLAEEILSDLVVAPRGEVPLNEIENLVCETCGMPKESLRSKSRTKSLSQPRMLAMWLARQHTRCALSEIGRFFGDRSHSSVISAQKRVDEWLAEAGNVAAQINEMQKKLHKK